MDLSNSCYSDINKIVVNIKSNLDDIVEDFIYNESNPEDIEALRFTALKILRMSQAFIDMSEKLEKLSILIFKQCNFKTKDEYIKYVKLNYDRLEKWLHRPYND